MIFFKVFILENLYIKIIVPKKIGVWLCDQGVAWLICQNQIIKL